MDFETRFQHFFENCVNDINNDAPRWVFSDWLLEHGDKRGELLALQLANHHVPPSHELLGRERTLRKLVEPIWLKGLIPPLSKELVEFRRGLLWSVDFSSDTLIKEPHRLDLPVFRTVQTVRLPYEVERWAAVPAWIQFLRHRNLLNVSELKCVTPTFLTSWLQSPTHKLTSLHLLAPFETIETSWYESHFANQALAHITSFSCIANVPFEALTDSPFAKRLTSVEVRIQPAADGSVSMQSKLEPLLRYANVERLLLHVETVQHMRLETSPSTISFEFIKGENGWSAHATLRHKKNTDRLLSLCKELSVWPLEKLTVHLHKLELLPTEAQVLLSIQKLVPQSTFIARKPLDTIANSQFQVEPQWLLPPTIDGTFNLSNVMATKERLKEFAPFSKSLIPFPYIQSGETNYANTPDGIEKLTQSQKHYANSDVILHTEHASLRPVVRLRTSQLVLERFGYGDLTCETRLFAWLDAVSGQFPISFGGVVASRSPILMLERVFADFCRPYGPGEIFTNLVFGHSLLRFFERSILEDGCAQLGVPVEEFSNFIRLSWSSPSLDSLRRWCVEAFMPSLRQGVANVLSAESIRAVVDECWGDKLRSLGFQCDQYSDSLFEQLTSCIWRSKFGTLHVYMSVSDLVYGRSLVHVRPWNGSKVIPLHLQASIMLRDVNILQEQLRFRLEHIEEFFTQP